MAGVIPCLDTANNR